MNILDRSLSQSFAEERKILSNKYKGTPHDTVEEAVEVHVYTELGAVYRLSLLIFLDQR